MAPIKHITVVPASAKTTTAAIKALLASPSPPQVRGIYRDLAKVPEAFASNPNFTAVKGTVEDTSSLDLGEKCDAVITITPPLYGPPPEDGTVGFTRRLSENLKKAVQAKGIGRVVLLSSWGAQFSEGTVRYPILCPGEENCCDGDPARRMQKEFSGKVAHRSQGLNEWLRSGNARWLIMRSDRVRFSRTTPRRWCSLMRRPRSSTPARRLSWRTGRWK